VFEEGGKLREYVGGYTDWLRQGKELAELDRHQSGTKRDPEKGVTAKKPEVAKLSYKEQRELDQLPEQIESLESRVDALGKEISASDFYSQGHELTQPVLTELADIQATLDQVLERWTALEDRVRAYRENRPK
jgi:ATP-binding cassette subfamily F protein uup